MPRVRRYHDGTQSRTAEMAKPRNQASLLDEVERDLQGARALDIEAATRLQALRREAMRQSGLSARDAAEAAQRGILALRDEMIGQAASPRMQAMFDDVLRRREEIVRQELDAHVKRSIDAARLDHAERLRQLARQDAIEATTPFAYQTNIRTVLDALDEHGLLTGRHPREVLATKVREQSGIHADRIAMMLERGDAEGAAAWLVSNRDGLSAQDTKRVEALMTGPLTRPDSAALFGDMPPSLPGGGKGSGLMDIALAPISPERRQSAPDAAAKQSATATDGQDETAEANTITVVGQRRSDPGKFVTTNEARNKIIGARLDEDAFNDQLSGGLLSTMRPDRSRKGDGVKRTEYDALQGEAPNIAAISNVDVAADQEAIAFILRTAPNLSRAKVSGSQKVEKYVMVEWDPDAGRYIVTAVKILVENGGRVTDIQPTLPSTLEAIKAGRPPRAFVIHTHWIGVERESGTMFGGTVFEAKPSRRDSDMSKRLLVPNFVVEAGKKRPKIYQVTLVAGLQKPKAKVLQHFEDGRVVDIEPYEGMPE